jgi:glycosyltransferase involved in cell wall biosynthesis
MVRKNDAWSLLRPVPAQLAQEIAQQYPTSIMRILVAHNRYKYAGGEDTVMRAEVEMLSSAGHEVEVFEVDNQVIQGIGAKIVAAGSLFHSQRSYQKMAESIRTFRPDILHIHNWFPLLSPAVISAATEAGVPVVQTLHNFRMLCANAILFRGGKVCHDCLGKALPLGGITHGCYSASRVGSALVTAAFSYHRLANTWSNVSIFIALSEFQRGLLIRGGLNPAQIVVKPNFVRDTSEAGTGSGGYALFVGRLTPEKGIRTVLEAWKQNSVPVPLKIMGDGPLIDEVREKTAGLSQVEYLGQRSSEEVYAAMANAAFLIFSSEWYEPFALTIVEAFSRGTPVLAADLESISELVKDGKTGLCFTPGDAADLAAKATSMIANGAVYRTMRRQCRRIYEERYTEKINYRLLMNIYKRAIASIHVEPRDYRIEI